MSWDTSYKGISVCYEDRIIQVKCDEILMNYLGQPGKQDALVLADQIIQTYQKKMQKPLQISRHSLAVEILIHAYIDKLCEKVEQKENLIPGVDQVLRDLCKKIEHRTEVIDCGERAVDNNRIVFDMLSSVHGAIYAMLNDKA